VVGRLLARMEFFFLLACAVATPCAADEIVVFRNVLTPAEKLSIRTLPELRDDRRDVENALRDGEIWIADVVLRRVGRQRLVVLQTGLFCGSAGCTTLILDRIGQRWRVLGGLSFEVNELAPLRILPESDVGWRRLAWGGNRYRWVRCGYWWENDPEEGGTPPESWCG
jgi:hypothetical protein